MSGKITRHQFQLRRVSLKFFALDPPQLTGAIEPSPATLAAANGVRPIHAPRPSTARADPSPASGKDCLRSLRRQSGFPITFIAPASSRVGGFSATEFSSNPVDWSTWVAGAMSQTGTLTFPTHWLLACSSLVQLAPMMPTAMCSTRVVLFQNGSFAELEQTGRLSIPASSRVGGASGFPIPRSSDILRGF
jgi:hypothetical protein